MAKKFTINKNIKLNTLTSSSSFTPGIGFDGYSEDQKKAIRAQFEKGNSASLETKVVELPSNYEVRSLDRSLLVEAPEEWNFFKKPDEKALLDLAISIYNNSLLQPIIVREIDNGKYQILAGHSRNAAYQLLYELFNDEKYLSISAIVFCKDILNDNKAKEIIIDSNVVQRGKLSRQEMTQSIKMKIALLKAAGGI